MLAITITLINIILKAQSLPKIHAKLLAMVIISLNVMGIS